MGRDKALLPLGEQTFLERIAEALAGEVAPLLIVVGHHAAEIAEQVPARFQARILHNPDYKLGQLSSLWVALRALEQEPVSAALVCLVDHPTISKPVVRALLERFRQTGAPVVIPTHQGRRGHPVLLARSLFPELLAAPLEQGARAVVQRHAQEVELVETDDEGVLWDIDRPEDYERLRERWTALNRSGRPRGESA
jgi:molybdenum cofactor cytidylyltransferase